MKLHTSTFRKWSIVRKPKRPSLFQNLFLVFAEVTANEFCYRRVYQNSPQYHCFASKMMSLCNSTGRIQFDKNCWLNDYSINRISIELYFHVNSIFTACQWSCGTVMFSAMSVCLSFCLSVRAPAQASLCVGSHCPVQGASSYMFKLIHYVAHMVGNW